MMTITPAEVAKYTLLFEQLSPVDGKLDGEKCKAAMMKSQLSVETLGRVWDLSDIDNDGCLDRQEFILAMHLIHRCVEGDMLPDSLPQNLVPPGKERFFAHFTFSPATTDPFATPSIPATMALVPLPKSTWSDPMGLGDVSQFSSMALTSQPFASTIPTQFTQTMATVWPQFGANTTPQTYTYPPWAVSSEEMAKASKVFSAIDVDADGLLSGAEVRDVLMRSGLQQAILAQIWELVDVHGTGMLNCEQFAVAMHLATEQLASSPYARPLPALLPPALVPPSLRPVPPDPAIFEESNKLIAEIETINRERAEVEAAYATLNVESQRRATEMATVQRTVDALSHTSRSLVNQRNEAERRLTDYAHERDTLASILNELKGHVASERQKVEEMRMQISNQQVSAKSQEEEIARLRNEVNDLIREEAILQDRLSESRRRMEAIEAENRVAQSRIDKTSGRVHLLESTRSQLLEVLDQYTNLLNGTATGVPPDETKIKSLLAESSLEGSVASFDTGLGGSRHAPIGGGFPSAFGDLDWSTTSVSRGLGASSVPLPMLSTTSAIRGATDRAHTGSALGVPISADPFLASDPFGAIDNGTSKAQFSSTAADKAFTSDPFGSANLFSTSDPFKDIDPFGGDPFTLPNDQPKRSANLDTSAFDPFSTTNPSVPASNVITGTDFDSVFGSSSATTGQANANDPFGTDPFGSLELAAITGQVSQQIGGATTTSTAAATIGSKKSPPPRPKTQPGAGRSGRERKSLGGSPEPINTLKSPNSLGSFPSFSNSKSGGFNTWGQSKHKSSGGFTSRVRGLSGSGLTIGLGKSKKDSDSITHQNRSNSFAMTGSGKQGDATDWSTSIGMSEEEQLSLATIESRQLAQAEERARQQEQADLELAIRLSQMDATAS